MVTGRGHMDVNRISGYIPGKIVFFLMQVWGAVWDARVCEGVGGGGAHRAVNRISGYIPGKIVFFLIQVWGARVCVCR